jgi:DNA-binding GntR family transcriptional regulator
MRDHIKHVLMDQILDGTYAPGERLIELQIAREMNTSQGPVREALRDLEGLGLVTSERYKGTRVREISQRELKETYQLRGALEELAAILAAPKLKNNTKALESELAALTKGAKAADRALYADHVMAFHRTIIEASDNQVLLSVWQSVLLESRIRVTVSRMTDSQLLSNARDRIKILDALKKGQGRTAGKLLRQHAEQFHSAALPD